MPVVYQIKVTEGYGAGSVYTLPADGEVIIGRHSKCGIRILDPDISRRQAKLTTQFGKWAVVPISSTVNTYFDGHAIFEPKVLRHTDHIVVGTTLLVVEITRT